MSADIKPVQSSHNQRSIFISKKCLIPTALVAAVLTLVGLTLAAHFGVMGQGAKHFLNAKIFAPIQHDIVQMGKLPIMVRFCITSAFSLGIFAFTLSCYLLHKGCNKRSADRKNRPVKDLRSTLFSKKMLLLAMLAGAVLIIIGLTLAAHFGALGQGAKHVIYTLQDRLVNAPLLLQILFISSLILPLVVTVNTSVAFVLLNNK